ncbi:hypothetical protein L2E82_02300 [Cichorium intybus]|uniref:Uncharacterized protein n=1 Tax=Cichorium intybus TaxID=13427 RepID=A0ACB9H1A3_CICIN|nr:hypothetical protein L2E82_02300 [Cichorium intybus]
MKIGIIELEVNLAPFDTGEMWGENNNYINDEHDSSDEHGNNDAYDSGSDMEGMSDTWNNNVNADREEGEIHDDEQMDDKEHPGEIPIGNDVLDAEESAAIANDVGHENPLEDDIVEESQFNPIISERRNTNDVLINDQGFEESRFNPIIGERGDVNDILINDQGLLNKDAAANSKAAPRLNHIPNTDPGFLNFGPFPSWAQIDPSVLPNLPESPKNFESTSPFEVDRSNDKRRKVSKFTRTKSCPPITDTDRNSFSIDLNRDVSQRQIEPCDNISNSESHASQELRKTVEVDGRSGELEDLRKRNNELDLIVESRPLSIGETTEMQKNKIRINDLDRFW